MNTHTQQDFKMQVSPQLEDQSVVLYTKKPSIVSYTFNMLNVVFGAGILGIPYAFYKAGLVLGSLTCILMALTTFLSYYLLVWTVHEVDATSYASLSYIAFGRVGRAFTRIILILDQFGTLTAFWTVIADSSENFLENFLKANSPFLDRKVLMAFSILIVLPLSLLKNINWLGFTSFLSLIPVVYLVFLQITFYAIEHKSTDGLPPLFADDIDGFFLALPIINFSFASQISFFTLYSNLKQRGGKPSDMRRVCLYTVVIAGLLYLVCGIIGILAFPTDIEGNIMFNFTPHVSVDILLVSMALAIIFGYPVTLFVMREIIDEFLFSNLPWSNLRFILEAFVIIYVTYLVAVLIPSFITILGLFGSITKVFICQIFPGLFYLRVGPQNWRKDKKKWAAILLLVAGGAAGVVSSVITIKNTNWEKFQSNIINF